MIKYLHHLCMIVGIVLCFSMPASAKIMYAKTNTYAYAHKNKDKKILYIEKYEKINCTVNKKSNWATIKINGKKRYIQKNCLTTQKPYINKSCPSNSFKSYMSYTAITNRSSSQYKLQQQAKTGKYGIRTVNGRYCIAVGTYYTTKIGTKIDLIMKNDAVIKCIVGDIKADQHTDYTHRKTSNGCISEFIVDTKSLHKTAKKMGDMSYCSKTFSKKIKKMRVYQY